MGEAIRCSNSVNVHVLPALLRQHQDAAARGDTTIAAKVRELGYGG